MGYYCNYETTITCGLTGEVLQSGGWTYITDVSLENYNCGQCSICIDGDKDGYYGKEQTCYYGGHYGGGPDCDDNDPTIYPGAPELCDKKDNNCNGEVDEGISIDEDGDGHYTPSSCKTPHDDCADGDPTVHPGAPEICNNSDDNCNGAVDEGISWDTDGDGHYTPASCKTPRDDCNDGNPAAYPGAPEICDSEDNNCNGTTDEGLSWDTDIDGHYTPNSCKTPHDDCDDGNPAIYPGAPELCDSYDNNCNGRCNEDLQIDTDKDGFFSMDSCVSGRMETCFVIPGNDCDDNNSSITPVAPEKCGDNVDNNCNRSIDEGCTTKNPFDDPMNDVCLAGHTTKSRVNVATGNLYHSQDIVSAKRGALDLDLTLYYNSLDTYSGPLGRGWTHSYNINLKKGSDDYTLMEADGIRVHLKRNGNVYTPANAAYPALSVNPDGSYLYRKEGVFYLFNSNGKIILDLLQSVWANLSCFSYRLEHTSENLET